MALTLAYDAHTEIGLVRSNNQDSAYTSPRMLMVADGMGGAAAGDLASAVAAWELEKTDGRLDDLIAAARAERLDDPGSESEVSGAEPTEGLADEDPGDLADVLTVMAGALSRANERLVELVDDDPTLAGMGTTVCGFVLAEDRLAVVNIGDSRAYLIRDGALHRVTRDHSWVQTLVDEGRISEEEALEHPHRSLVLRVLNGASQHEPDLGWLDIVPGDRLLVCSDGLCGLVTDADIAAIATTGAPREATIERLVALAHQAGGHDNITLILADVETDGAPGATAVIGAAATVSSPETTEHTATLAPVDAEGAPTASDVDAEAANERTLTEEERYALTGRRRPSVILKLSLAILLPVIALAGGAYGWYQYTQTRYYIGPSDAHVALYRGVPDVILGASLSTLLETDPTRIADLPPYYATKVQATIPVDGVEAAQATLVELREKAKQCIAQREARAQATAEPTPEPSPTPDPSVTPDAS
ncbi:MAG: protein phosphatase 2C domain-containing protein, partial [Propionibacteriaceae bacterium]|nr:protein phosphatase 2C domain-containing protein [Propionibacteriaceae bacterium]